MIGTVHSLDKRPKQPPALVGFQDVNRYWDQRMNLWAAKVLPGELYVSLHGEMISTVLGSCISACVRDVQKGIGGMNHFMLPEPNEHSSDNWGSDNLTTRYGNWAMEALLNELFKRGAKKQHIEVKLFGGGQIIQNMTDIGARNISFARQYMAAEGFKVVAEDVGGQRPRKVLYFPDTGAVKVKRLNQVSNQTIFTRERNYAKHVNVDSTDGSVELF
jgi:chemotaxis protein CheD